MKVARYVLNGRCPIVIWASTLTKISDKAPLKTAYADCIATAIDESDGEHLYQFIFREGKVFFRVVLPPDTDANPSEFSAVSILGSRPYVRWAIAD